MKFHIIRILFTITFIIISETLASGNYIPARTGQNGTYTNIKSIYDMQERDVKSKSEHSHIIKWRNFSHSVRKAIKRQMTKYPYSTLQDIYKYFFQDRFGPGHIIEDKESAAKYIKYEIEQASVFDGETAELIGWQGNFVRVNLSLVKDGQININTLTNALIRSAQIQVPTMEEWINEWNTIAKIAIKIYPELQNQTEEINGMLSAGNYVMHHSEIYNNAYERHYRIIKTEIWEKELRPLLKLDTRNK